MVDVHLFVAEVRTRSLHYAFRFWKNDAGERVEVARGQVATVSAALDKVTGRMSAVPIPAKIRELLELAPAELLAVFSPGKQN